MTLFNCGINLVLTWCARCFIINAHLVGQEPTFKTTNTKSYVPVETLSTQNNAKLLIDFLFYHLKYALPNYNLKIYYILS